MRSPKRVCGVLVLASVLGVSAAQAQGGVGVGFTDIGAVVGLGNVGGASFSLGGRFEKITKSLPDLGDGLLGFQVGADWWSWNLPGAYDVSWIPIGVTANYHFKMENKKVDPFLGAGLGYQSVSVSGPGCGGTFDACSGWNSGLYFITKAGIRYFMNDNMAAYADLGVGAATLNAGLVWKMKGGSANASRARR